MAASTRIAAPQLEHWLMSLSSTPTRALHPAHQGTPSRRHGLVIEACRRDPRRRHDEATMAGVRGEDSVIPQKMASRARHEGRQPRVNVERVEQDLGGALAGRRESRGQRPRGTDGPRGLRALCLAPGDRARCNAVAQRSRGLQARRLRAARVSARAKRPPPRGLPPAPRRASRCAGSTNRTRARSRRWSAHGRDGTAHARRRRARWLRSYTGANRSTPAKSRRSV